MQKTSSTIPGREPVGSRQGAAASVGELVKTKIERGDRYSAPEIYNLELMVLDVVRGAEARQRLQKEQRVDVVSHAGFEYLLARLRFGYFSKGRGLERRGEPYIIGNDFFAARSSDGRTEYAMPSLARQPQPQLIDVPFLPGESKEGWIVLEVPEAEKEPYLIFKREFKEFTYGVWGPVWFRLN